MLWFLWPAGGVGIQRQQQREKERGGERQRALREWQMERSPSWLAQNEDKFYVARKLRSLFIVSVHSSLSNACASPLSRLRLLSLPFHMPSSSKHPFIFGAGKGIRKWLDQRLNLNDQGESFCPPPLYVFLSCCCLFETVIKRIKKSLALPPQWKRQRSVPSLNMHLFYSYFAYRTLSIPPLRSSTTSSWNPN